MSEWGLDNTEHPRGGTNLAGDFLTSKVQLRAKDLSELKMGDRNIMWMK